MFQLGSELVFPPVEYADEFGFLAYGGDLSVERLLLAYRKGIFPWYNADQPILWWSPDPRMVIYPSRLHVSRSLGRFLRQKSFSVTLDTDFRGVIQACAQSRLQKGEDTWISPEIIAAYTNLHNAGYAHSIEVWSEGALVGGMYGVSLGRAFFGESMFALKTNASKTAMAFLCAQLARWEFGVLDCQVANPHLERMGGVNIPRREFIKYLWVLLKYPTQKGRWVLDGDITDSF